MIDREHFRQFGERESLVINQLHATHREKRRSSLAPHSTPVYESSGLDQPAWVAKCFGEVAGNASNIFLEFGIGKKGSKKIRMVFGESSGFTKRKRILCLYQSQYDSKPRAKAGHKMTSLPTHLGTLKV